MRKRKKKKQIEWISFLSGMPKKQVAKEIEKDLSIAYDRMERMTELSQEKTDNEFAECDMMSVGSIPIPKEDFSLFSQYSDIKDDELEVTRKK
ncbi:hypothetical protein ES707_02305 [subsurface metagenome]